MDDGSLALGILIGALLGLALGWRLRCGEEPRKAESDGVEPPVVG